MADTDWIDDPKDDGDGWVDDSSDTGALPEPNRYSRTDAAVMQGLHGWSGNFLDELSGAGEAAGRVVGIKGLGGRFSDLETQRPGITKLLKEGAGAFVNQVIKDYDEGRDKKREILADQAKEYPGTAAAANVVGAVASPINKLTKGMSLAKGGAVIGGITAAGNSEAESGTDLLIDTATGVGLGLVLGKGAEKIGKVADKGTKKVSEKSRSAAEWLAGRALGAERGTIKSLGPDKVRAAGRQALKEKVLSPLASTDDLIARNDAVRKKGGELMDKAYGAIDEAGASTFSPLNVASKIDSELSPVYRTPINKSEVSQLENTIESVLARGDQNIPLREAQKLKEEIGAVAFPKGKRPIDPSPKQQMALDAYDIVNKSIDDAVEAGSKHVETAGLSSTLAKGKSIYGNSKTTEKLLANKQAREGGNKLLFGLTDTITGVGSLGYGGTTGDWETAAGIMLAKKGLEKYGVQNSAILADKIAKAATKSRALGRLATQKVGEKSQGLISSPAATHVTEKVGKLRAAQNEEAPKKGPQKWANDGFEKIVESIEDENLKQLLRDQEPQIKQDVKAMQLLIRASDLKPGSPAMEKIKQELLKKQKSQGGN